MSTYDSIGDLLAAFEDDVRDLAKKASTETAQDAALLFVGGTPIHGTLTGSMNGIFWDMRRDTGEARDGIRVRAGDHVRFPQVKRKAYPSTEVMVTRAIDYVKANPSTTYSIGSSDVEHTKFLERRYKIFEGTVGTLYGRLS